jgi:hypothetical protein
LQVSGRNCNKQIVLIHWAVDGGVPAWMGFYHFFMIKGQAPPPSKITPKGTLKRFDFEMSGQKKRGCLKTEVASFFLYESLAFFSSGFLQVIASFQLNEILGSLFSRLFKALFHFFFRL